MINSIAVASRRMATQQHPAVAVNIFGRSSYFASQSRRSMGTITKGVDFDTIAREWRCKWSKDDDMQSLQDAQKALEDILSDLKETAGCKSVHRVVCGGELDFKVVTSISADDFASWKDADFAPEASFLDKLSTIDGITKVETQTYTFMEV